MPHLPHGRRVVTRGALAVALLIGCDSSTTFPPFAPALRLATAALVDEDGALFIGNLVAGVPAGNGIMRYTAGGTFVDRFAQGGCCMTFGPDEHLYIARQNAVHKVHGVTGASLGVVLPANTVVIPFIPALGPDGMLYVSFRGSSQLIRRYDKDGVEDPTFLVDGNARGVTGGQFYAFGPDGNIYWASGTSEVLRFSATDGSFIDTFVEAGAGGLVAPSGVAFDRQGILYVASPSTDRVLRFDRHGAYLGDFVPAGAGGLDTPVGITFGPDGDLYVASAGSPETAGVLRYDGVSGAFKGALVGPGDGIITGPRTIQFKTKIAVCHAPPGQLEKSGKAGRTLHIGYFSAADHMQHGDEIGACP